MHHVLMRHVAIGKHDLDRRMGAAKRFELALLDDRDAVRVERARERGGIAPAGNARDLRRRECHHLRRRVVAIHDIEVVEVASGRSDDDDTAPACRRTLAQRGVQGHGGSGPGEAHVTDKG